MKRANISPVFATCCRSGTSPFSFSVAAPSAAVDCSIASRTPRASRRIGSAPGPPAAMTASSAVTRPLPVDSRYAFAAVLAAAASPRRQSATIAGHERLVGGFAVANSVSCVRARVPRGPCCVLSATSASICSNGSACSASSSATAMRVRSAVSSARTTLNHAS